MPFDFKKENKEFNMPNNAPEIVTAPWQIISRHTDGRKIPIKLKYGNTNTYFVNRLLIDTDMAGSMPMFRRELKKQGIARDAIRYVLATHYHPDHMGLIGELTRNGVKLLLLEHQKEFVHSSDTIYARDRRSGFVQIDESVATVISTAESREFLAGLGISGEIVPTKSHSADGAALVLDDGCAFVGDLEPRGFLDGYAENDVLREDWDGILRLGARVIYYGHANEQRLWL